MLNLKLWMQKVSELLKSLKDTVAGHTTSISSLNTTVSGHTSTINSHTSTINSHTSTINSHGTSLTSHANRITTLENKVGKVYVKYGSKSVTFPDGHSGGTKDVYVTFASLGISGITANNLIGVKAWIGWHQCPTVNPDTGANLIWVQNAWNTNGIHFKTRDAAQTVVVKCLVYYT